MGDQVESDHQPVVIKIRREGREKVRGRRGGVGGSRGRLDEEVREEFKRRLGGVKIG